MKNFSCTLYLIMSFFCTTCANVPLIPREVLFGEPTKIFSTLSPDGTKLAYLAPHNGVLNIWIKSINKDNDAVITDRTGRGIHDYHWTYDNQSIIYSYDVTHGAEEHHLFKVDIATKAVVDLTPGSKFMAGMLAYYPSYPDQMLIMSNKRDARYFDVYKLNLNTYELTLVEQNPGDISSYIAAVTDDGLHVRGAIKQKPDASREFYVRANEQEPWRLLITWKLDDEYSGPLGFHKDGHTLYLADSRGANTTQLIKLDLETNTKTVLAHDEQYDIHGITTNIQTHEPMYTSFMKDRHEVIALDPRYQADLDAIRKLDDGDFYIHSWTLDYAHCIVDFIKDNASPRCYLYDRATKTGTLLFDTKPELQNYRLAKMEPVSFPSRDGLTLHGYLTCPVDQPRTNLPLVLLVHGGPWGRDKWGFNQIAQLFANRGYACLQINYRGSTGYGKNFLNAANKEFGRKTHNDLIDAVNWAINTGIADKKRIAIAGGSYGGYAALCGAAFTPDVFCCAIDLFGFCNLVTLFKNLPPHWETGKARWHNCVGNPETEEALLKERSPLFSAHNIKIPLLVIQGTKDIRCTPQESQQLVAAAARNNISCEYHEVDEGHGCSNPANRIKYIAEYPEKFLARHLGGRCQ